MKREEIKKEYKGVYAVGDLHGNMTALKRYTSYVEDSLIIQVGDFGLGFYIKPKYDGDLTTSIQYQGIKRINDFLVEDNNEMIVIRGNHDDPLYWSGYQDYNEEFSNICFIEDYSTIKINNKDVCFIGGAVSVDMFRRNENVDYWSGEKLSAIPDSLGRCDILITHTCPSYHNKPSKVGDEFLDQFLEKDPNLLSELVEERSTMDKIVEITQPKLNIGGHFHNDMTSDKSFDWGECRFRTFDIDECDEITEWFE